MSEFKKLWYLLWLLVPLSLFGQQSSPTLFNRINKEEIPMYVLSPVDEEKLLKEDSIQRSKGDKTFRFGYPVRVEKDIWREGKIIPSDSGKVCCVYRIRSKNARNINLIFSGMDLPEGSSLFIYDSHYENISGGFTGYDVNPDHTFSTLPMAGEELILEYNGPVDAVPEIELSYIIHGYIDFKKTLRDFGESGACNINIKCAEGDGWSNEAASTVMLITANNSRFCTGAMVNNTSRDGTPYVLTAEHCEPSSTDIFLFNYQSDGCANADGKLNQTIQGCTIRASNKNSDFALVELNRLPENFSTFLSGWDHTGEKQNKSTIIHHPEGDVKKISRDKDSLSTETYEKAVCWKIADYEFGTTEPGSSGAPLFDTEKKIIGQLNGGEASCDFNFNDYYGKFSVSWDGNNPWLRLKDWLDPKSSQEKIIQGIPYSFVQQSFDARSVAIKNIPDIICGDSMITPVIEIKNMGTLKIDSLDIFYQINNENIQQIRWNEPLNSLSTAEISLNEMQVNDLGLQKIKTWTSFAGSFQDLNPLNDTLVKEYKNIKGFPLQLTIKTDRKPLEFSLEIINESNEIIYALPSGTLGDEIENRFDICLPEGCYTFKAFDLGANGICCDSGIGFYSLKNKYGQEMIIGGKFKEKIQHDFCLDSNLNLKKLKDTFEGKLFPIPADAMLNIEMPKYPGIKKISVYNTTGQMILSDKYSSNSIQINTQLMKEGLYILRIETDEGVYGKLFNVVHPH